MKNMSMASGIIEKFKNKARYIYFKVIRSLSSEKRGNNYNGRHNNEFMRSIVHDTLFIPFIHFCSIHFQYLR